MKYTNYHANHCCVTASLQLFLNGIYCFFEVLWNLLCDHKLGLKLAIRPNLIFSYPRTTPATTRIPLTDSGNADGNTLHNHSKGYFSRKREFICQETQYKIHLGCPKVFKTRRMATTNKTCVSGKN